MGGANLHEGVMEVAFEQWIERARQKLQQAPTQFPRYRETVSEVIPVLAECREDSLNLGGTADLTIRPKLIGSLGFSFSYFPFGKQKENLFFR